MPFWTPTVQVVRPFVGVETDLYTRSVQDSAVNLNELQEKVEKRNGLLPLQCHRYTYTHAALSDKCILKLRPPASFQALNQECSDGY